MNPVPPLIPSSINANSARIETLKVDENINETNRTFDIYAEGPGSRNRTWHTGLTGKGRVSFIGASMEIPPNNPESLTIRVYRDRFSEGVFTRTPILDPGILTSTDPFATWIDFSDNILETAILETDVISLSLRESGANDSEGVNISITVILDPDASDSQLPSETSTTPSWPPP